MTCQVSDVQVKTTVMRRTVLWHGVVSFFFNTVFIAITAVDTAWDSIALRQTFCATAESRMSCNSAEKRPLM